MRENLSPGGRKLSCGWQDGGMGDGGDGRSLEGNIEEGEVSGTRKEKADSCYGAGVSESGGLESKTSPTKT